VNRFPPAPPEVVVVVVAEEAEAAAPVAPVSEKETLEPDGVRVLSAVGPLGLLPRDAELPFTFVLSEKGVLEEMGVDVFNGPRAAEPLPNPTPEEPRFRLADLRTGIRLP
jgi:hypothetical protein